MCQDYGNYTRIAFVAVCNMYTWLKSYLTNRMQYSYVQKGWGLKIQVKEKLILINSI